MHGEGSEHMSKEDSPAKLAIIHEWDSWSNTHSDPGGMLFFMHLRRDRPDLLLDFKTPGEKWPLVHAWLLQEGKVKE
jgi:hypothetical protein